MITEARMISLLQWRSCNNRCSRCSRPSTHRKLLAKQRLNSLLSKLSNKNKENDRSKSVNSTDDLAAKVDHLLKGNQSQVFIMEEAASENNVSDATSEEDNTMDDQQEVGYVNGQGWQYKNYHPNPNVRNNPHLFVYPRTDKPVQHNQFQNQKQQTAQQTASSPTTSTQDEMKGLATMMQQLLQRQQIQGKALNQVTTDINSRMNHMFNDLSTKYDNVASHMRQMDVQIAQTAESVKRQQGTMPGKTDKNLKECSIVPLRNGRTLLDAVPKKLSEADKGKQKEGEQLRSEAPPLSDEEPEQCAETDPTPVATPVEHVPSREYTSKVPYPIPAKTSRKDREETKCKRC
ncbi:hypothetical protein F2Q68_00044204 [Brassica cretica]|uniref:Uncharacterized protein n=1 Tax=Brassica cretica TaxID=69181 RepID=A0A8S9LER1_BRACR|nr:hypothetical protein F2Q68_00044204 [Brassica cretica]